jgi:hypothetical protein
MIFLAAMTIVATPITFIIVKYEREKSNRTLINQLLSSMLVWTSVPSTANQILVVVRFMCVANPKVFCYLDLFFKPGIILTYIMFLDAILVVRYIFIFHTKNPTANQDDFWNCFLCIWMTSISIIYQFVFILLPGNNPNFFYICLGRISQNHKNETMKENLVLRYLLVISALAHLFVGVRYFIFKHQERKTIETGKLDY